MAFSFKIKNKAFYILLFLGLTIISCDPLKNSDTAVNENHSCSLTDSLLGKEFLEKDILIEIEKIKNEEIRLNAEMSHYNELATNKELKNQKFLEIEKYLSKYFHIIELRHFPN